MKLKKALLVTGAATTIGLSAMAGVASAATNTSGTDTNGDSSTQSLADKIATKFNLNKDEVKAVFEEDRAAREEEMQQKFEERLTEAVTEGKITSDQKEKILAKHEETRTYMESLKDKTKDERHDLMKQKMDELKQWAEDNDIPAEYLRMGGHGMHRGVPPQDAELKNSKSE